MTIIDLSEAQMASPRQKRWSQWVTKSSKALDLEPGVFTWRDPRQIAPIAEGLC
jgi:hypothetical protein